MIKRYFRQEVGDISHKLVHTYLWVGGIISDFDF